jgi:hypothetical protein
MNTDFTEGNKGTACGVTRNHHVNVVDNESGGSPELRPEPTHVNASDKILPRRSLQYFRLCF